VWKFPPSWCYFYFNPSGFAFPKKMHCHWCCFFAQNSQGSCLLELEEILRLGTKHSFEASLLTSINQEWIIKKNTSDTSFKECLCYMMKVIVGSKKTLNSTSSSWCLIQIPSGFDVNDVVLVNLSIPPMIYGIQLTWSVKPFVNHHTFDTCPPRSKERLEKLWSIVSNIFNWVIVYSNVM